MRNAWLLLGLALLGGVAGPLACGQAFVVTGSTSSGGMSTAAAGPGVGGSGGDTSASSGGGSTSISGATSSTGTGMSGAPCKADAECPGLITLCGEPACIDGFCSHRGLQPNGNSSSQLYGDCHFAKCLNATLVNGESDTDVYDDGNECTDDVCKNGMPSNTPKPGSQCGVNGVCNDKGACVECTGNDVSKCPGAQKACINGYCSALTCQDGMKDFNETDEDCGGDECAPCGDTSYCLVPKDCTSGVCKVPPAEALMKCIAASCTDLVKNGKETDTDCGGPDCQVKCQVNMKCAVGGDCMSGVCQAGKCQQANCKDGVKNGMEKGVDCGASGCALKCPGG
jgi:hypothetical protein